MERQEDQWVVDLQNSLKTLDLDCSSKSELWEKHCIYKVPAYLAELNKHAYTPQLVALGPFHRAQPHLQPMESHKQRAVLHFLNRSKHQIQDYLNALKTVEQYLKACYQWPGDMPPPISSDFLRMMLLDGCFLLELHQTIIKGDYAGYMSNDPVFGPQRATHVLPFVRRDMLMLENQIPLQVLQRLMDPFGDASSAAVHKLVLEFFLPKGTSLGGGDDNRLGWHALDVFRRHLVQGTTKSKTERSAANMSVDGVQGDETGRSATALNGARVRFKTSKSDGLMDVKFSNRVLHLPHIIIDDATESMFLNLMAFEHLHVGAGCEVSSYIWFMDNLIDTKKDVELLRSKGIIENGMGSDEEVALLFNKLSKEVTMEQRGPFARLQKELSDHCKRRSNRYCAEFHQSYLSSPWAILSLLAAVFLLMLTVAQTVYSGLSYHNPH